MKLAWAALPFLPLSLAFLRDRPRALWVTALCAFILSLTISLERRDAGIALFVTGLLLLKSLQAAAGHEKPPGYLDFVLFLLLPVIVRWDTLRRPDLMGAAQHAALGIGQVLLVRTYTGTLLGLRNPIAIVVATQLALYLLLAGWTNVVAAMLSLRGLDYDAPFRSPLLSRTPAEFWGRRWNTWVSYMLYRYVFVPVGGRRHPVRGALAAFAVSGLYHEAGALMFARRVTGWMMAYFLLQGVVVAATSHSRLFRRLAHRAPLVSGVMTLIFVLASGVIFIRAIDGIDPAGTWQRCCRLLFQS
jgi:hypothetical protein